MSAREVVVCTVGGGRYDLAAWCQWKQLQHYGYSGRYYLGYSDGQPLSRVWDGEPVTPIKISFGHGWTSKAILVEWLPDPVVLFLDADVYPVGEGIPNRVTSTLWPNVAGYCAIDTHYFDLVPMYRRGLDGGIWVIDKQVDGDAWEEYARLNHDWKRTYQHGFGDQDLLWVAWERSGKPLPILETSPSNIRGVGRHSPVNPWPGFIHRWKDKLATDASTLPSLPDEQLIRRHVREYRNKLRGKVT